LPLFLPPVIFGAGALVAQADGRSPAPALALLCACALVATMIGVLAGAAGLRGSRT
ncbi:MAG TPA: heme exporter protein CcmB, partial [Brevundimonas sp.]|nr:heme exporter protein CcmB [Brevundimonas sp.]